MHLNGHGKGSTKGGQRAPAFALGLGAPDVVHMPLRRVALCLDCEECFEIGGESCPACGSETWYSLARFLEVEPAEARPEPSPVQQLIVVSRTRPKLYEHLRRAFAGNATIRVTLDHRSGERRGAASRSVPERRARERRAGHGVDDQIRAVGWSVARPA